jgi:hypothetical protein
MVSLQLETDGQLNVRNLPDQYRIELIERA